ncbi:MAG TPA: hypothetical protein PKE00_06015 [Planctomycetota bacterium]|nr:hypothetical protein [Planctomycetota bacterium]
MKGGYTAAHTYGWTEFEVDPKDSKLTVTTWGIEPYTAEDLKKDPKAIVSRKPEVVSRFAVQPKK